MASSDLSPPTRSGSGGAASAGVALALAAVALLLGRGALVLHGLVNWDGLAAVSAAYTVVHAGDRPSLSLIGFARPPLTSLLLTPVAWLAPEECTAGVAQVVLGAAALLLAVWWYLSWMARLGLPLWASMLFVLGVFLHPIVLSLYAGGSPAALFFTLALIGLGSLANWASRLLLRDLITASVFLGLAALCDHLGVLLVAAAIPVVGLRAAFGPPPAEEPSAPSRWARAEGAAVLFALVPGYLLFLWVGTSWAIVGDPWQSWRHWVETSARYLGRVELFTWLGLGCGGWGAAVLFALLVRRPGLRPAAVAVLAVGVLSLALTLLWAPAGGGRAWDWGMAAAPVLAVRAAAAIILSLACADLLAAGRFWWTGVPLRLAAVGLLLVGAFLSVSRGLAGGWPAKPSELVQSRIGVAGCMAGARSALPLATRLLASVPPGGRIGVYTGDAPGFAVGLLAGLPWRIGDVAAGPEPRPGDLHLLRVPRSPSGAAPPYPLATHFEHVRPVFVRHEGEFLIYRFEPLMVPRSGAVPAGRASAGVASPPLP